MSDEQVQPPVTPAPPPSSPRRTGPRVGWWLGGVLVVGAVGAVAYGEHRGWPWLSAPVERMLSQTLRRDVSFGEARGQGQARVQLIGGIRVWADQLRIGAPEWSKTPFMVSAEGSYLQVAYHDLWRAYRGKPVLVEQLKARELVAWLERTADNKASWQFGPPRPSQTGAPSLLDGLHFDVLQLARGEIHYQDTPLALQSKTEVSMSVRDARRAPAKVEGDVAEGLRAQTLGSYQRLPLKASLTSGQLAPWLLGGEGRMAWPIDFHLNVGQARVDFNGSVDQLSAQADVLGNFKARGPSLAAMGEPLGVTLPTTGNFDMQGVVRHRGLRTFVVVKGAEIGTSVRSALTARAVTASRTAPPRQSSARARTTSTLARPRSSLCS